MNRVLKIKHRWQKSYQDSKHAPSLDKKSEKLKDERTTKFHQDECTPKHHQDVRTPKYLQDRREESHEESSNSSGYESQDMSGYRANFHHDHQRCGCIVKGHLSADQDDFRMRRYSYGTYCFPLLGPISKGPPPPRCCYPPPAVFHQHESNWNHCQSNMGKSMYPKDSRREESRIYNNDPRKATSKDYMTKMEVIASAIMSAPERKMMINEIYDHIRRNHPYFIERKNWTNGIRYTLSHLECFVQVRGLLSNRKGKRYWTVHPACVQSFTAGNFNIRHARRIVQKCLQKSQ